MTKEEIYIDINSFNNTSLEGGTTVSDARYYVKEEFAVDVTDFFKYLVESDKLEFTEIKNVVDLCFGSGNLTAHTLLDLGLNYEKVYLNDKNIDKSNVSIDLENSEIIEKDFLRKENFHITCDLIIFNPQIGGTKYDIGKLDLRKSTNNTSLVVETIDSILRDNGLLVFVAEAKNFKKFDFTSTQIKTKYIYCYNESIFQAKNVYILQKIDEALEVEIYKKDLENNIFLSVEICGNEEIATFNDNLADLFDELNEFEQNSGNDLLLDFKNVKNYDEQQNMETKKNSFIKFSSKQEGKENWQKDFKYKNILFKGVPGTGKSRAINEIIKKHLGLEKNYKNTLRINIHSASSNSDLMQGIGISTNANGNIKYSEKQGLILDIIKRATFHPNQPFILILEEIQENSLNELIGDLIYLIEDDKRAKLTADNEEYDSYEELVDRLVDKDDTLDYVEIPFLVNDSTNYKKMIMPDNLFIFCTSNYRDDKKVIEDNLLRRFEVVEIYPKNQKQMGKNDNEEYYFKRKEISDFLEALNQSILNVMKDNHEIHPDRFIIGHAIWQNVNDEQSFYKSFLKLVVEFKDIREIEFDTFKTILDKVVMPHELKTYNSYYEMIKDLQNKISYVFLN